MWVLLELLKLFLQHRLHCSPSWTGLIPLIERWTFTGCQTPWLWPVTLWSHQPDTGFSSRQCFWEDLSLFQVFPCSGNPRLQAFDTGPFKVWHPWDKMPGRRYHRGPQSPVQVHGLLGTWPHSRRWAVGQGEMLYLHLQPLYHSHDRLSSVGSQDSLSSLNPMVNRACDGSRLHSPYENHAETIFPPHPSPWKYRLSWNLPLVPKRLGTVSPNKILLIHSLQFPEWSVMLSLYANCLTPLTSWWIFSFLFKIWIQSPPFSG